MQKLKRLLLLSAFLISCKSIQNVMLSTNPENPLFEMHRGGCYGTCPIYSLSLYHNGKVKYEGIRFTDSIGIYEWKVEPKDFERMEELISEKFNNSSTHNLAVQDLPKTTVIVNNKHRIEYKGSCPNAFKTELKEMEQLLLKNAIWD